MRLTLAPHPDTPCDAVREIAVGVGRGADGWLELVFRLEGDLGAILWPEPSEDGGGSEPTDGIWRHTCFEAFVRQDGQAGYREMNMSPSLEWAMYAFTGYRDGMAPVGDAAFGFTCHRGETVFELKADVAVEASPAVPWRLGLFAVIELTDGSKSYWALAHAPGKPDFHHPDAFAAILPPESP